MAYQESIYGTCVTRHAHADQAPRERYEFDIHTHTIASGHGSSATITDMVKAAKAANLKTLGISDHGPATLGGGRISYFRNLKYAQRERLGIRMLYGAETNIINMKGNLDLSDDILANLDFVIASMHKPTLKPGTAEENTEAYIKAMKDPYVSIIGHCDDEKFPIDPFKLMREYGIVYQLMEFENLEGIYLVPEGENDLPVVGINYKRKITRQRFTAAHELCHHLKVLETFQEDL